MKIVGLDNVGICVLKKVGNLECENVVRLIVY